MEEVKFDKDLALKEAMNIFWRKGYHNTSLKELLNGMNILNGSFYNTFKSKKNLFLMALDKYTDLVLNKRITEFRLKDNFQKGIRAFFYQSIKDYNNQDIPNGCLVVNSIEEDILSDQEIDQKLKEILSRLYTFFKDELSLAIKSGQVSTELDVNITASILTNFSEGLSKSSLLREKPSFMKRKVNYLLSALNL